jgi:hypothetical protein
MEPQTVEYSPPPTDIRFCRNPLASKHDAKHASYMNAPDDGLLELSDVMARLGREFKRAAEIEDPVVEWYGATVELESVVERSADGSVRFWVASGGAKIANRQTIKITVNLNPFGGEPMAAGM